MKRFTLLMAAIICLAISALAQISENQTLSTTLWKQGIARCAHYTAYAKGFAKRSDELMAKFPQGYTLDDLNEVYSNQGQKWEKIYNEFKKNEDNNGSISDLKELVTPQIWKLVEPDFNTFISNHPEMMQDSPEQTADQQADGEQQPEQDGNANQDAADTASTNLRITCPADLPLWLGILGSLLGLCALLISLSNRGKIKEMRRTFARELDRTNANLQEFSTDAAGQMKALSIRLTGKAIRGNKPVAAIDEPVEEENTVAEEPQQEQEECAEIEQQEEEPMGGGMMSLFMSKPDENDNFTRVTDEFEPGNSIYVLDTKDGTHGTFEVIDKPEVHRFALMMPAENLIRACSGNAIQIPSGTRIVNDRPGEAEFIDGKWHIIVKAIIHYEG